MTSGPETARTLTRFEGPVLVHGANGFIGSQLLAALLDAGIPALGTVSSALGWRLRALGVNRVRRTSDVEELQSLLDAYRPVVILNLAAHGAYPEQQDIRAMVDVNIVQVAELAAWVRSNDAVLVHAGSSSEYGRNAGGANETTTPDPNSHYAVTKLAGTNLIVDEVRRGRIRATTLRLFSIFGPLEDPNRLVPTLIREGARGRLPRFSPAEVCRDFVHVDDVVEAFARAAARLAEGAEVPPILNIASSTETSMADVAAAARAVFSIDDPPVFAEPMRTWDLTSWWGDASEAARVLGWRATLGFAAGLDRTRRWYDARPDPAELLAPTRPRILSSLPDISAIVACYRDAEAIPEMVERLRTTFEAMDVSFEIVLVNDASPDDTLAVIEQISLTDDRVIGVTHARNFGSQSAFLSGMLVSRGSHVALLDGDLQDPPELLADMWRLVGEGNDVVYGRRIDREERWWLKRAYRAFYYVFQRFAPFHIPRDAGDFSLMTRRVVDVITEMPERGLFIRAQRAYAGFRQTGIDYVRPARPYGRSTNNLAKNVGWATRGILAVSRAPLTALSVSATVLFGLSVLVAGAYAALRILAPSDAPRGFTTLLTAVFVFGSINFLAVAVVGEYVGRVLEESKGRPRFIRASMTRSGLTIGIQSGRDGS